jgi:hypothetical protein
VSLFGPAPSQPFLYDSVTAAVAAAHEDIEVVPDVEGRARVAGYTVFSARDAADKLALVCDFDEARRTLRVVEDPELVQAATREEFCGRELELGAGDALRWL